jgi:Linalool dehydratase/isomerase
MQYSGHLLLMVSLYGMLFNDDKYEKEGALSFDWNPVFWGMGPERFLYNRESLQDTILAEMEKEKWLGVCCEPNAIFVVCNQFPVSSVFQLCTQW